jgi:hypothetical protein
VPSARATWYPELPGEAADEATLLRAMHGLVEDEAVA